jgi:Eco57I restriction-modification methylase
MNKDISLQRIEQKAKELERAVEHFRTIQTTYEIELDRTTSAEYKQEVRNKLDALRSELDPYLAMEYGIDCNNIPSEQRYQQKYEQWLKNHQPFHWFVEFYGIMTSGGFDVIIGNPPWKEYSSARKSYTVLNYATKECGNLYGMEQWQGDEGGCCRLMIGMQDKPEDELRKVFSLRGQQEINQATVRAFLNSGREGVYEANCMEYEHRHRSRARTS